jgi:hypothetical protein
MKQIEQQFAGKWRITRMEMWEQKFVDLVVPGFIKFHGDESEMRFIAVRAWLDIRYSESDGLPTAEFSWQGLDERDDRCGRGKATIVKPERIVGQFYFHMGDESSFEAVREAV